MDATKHSSINHQFRLMLAIVASSSPVLIINRVAGHTLSISTHAVFGGILNVRVQCIITVSLGGIHVECLICNQLGGMC